MRQRLDKLRESMEDGTAALISGYPNIFYYSGAANTLLTVTRGGGKITLRFSDDGKPYDPTTAKEPNVNLSAEEREIGGLGIYMVKKTAAEIDYKYEDGKNVLTVSFAE